MEAQVRWTHPAEFPEQGQEATEHSSLKKRTRARFGMLWVPLQDMLHMHGGALQVLYANLRHAEQQKAALHKRCKSGCPHTPFARAMCDWVVRSAGASS